MKNPAGSGDNGSEEVNTEPVQEATAAPTVMPTVKPSSGSGSGRTGGGGGGQSTGTLPVSPTEAPKVETENFTWASYDISVKSGETASIELYEDSNKNRPALTFTGNEDGTVSAIYEDEKNSYIFTDMFKCGIVYQVLLKIPVAVPNTLNSTDYSITVKK